MNIHVAGLSLNIGEADLETLFSSYGEVSYVVIVRNRKNGRSLGQAFVEMPNQAQAEQAVNALNDSCIDGNTITVRALEYKPGEFNN